MELEKANALQVNMMKLAAVSIYVPYLTLSLHIFSLRNLSSSLMSIHSTASKKILQASNQHDRKGNMSASDFSGFVLNY